MKKRITVALFATTLTQVLAQTPQLDVITVTTVTKTEKKIDSVTASVEVITADEIAKSGVVTTKGVIERIPSLTMQYARFPHPSSKSKASISIRGAGSNGTLILIDGKRLSAETENPYEMDRIPTAMIDRIEIVKGSQSVLYGSDAIGGVINIITKKTDKALSSVNIKYGQDSDGEAKEKSINLAIISKQGKLGYKLYASSIKTTPFEIDTNYTQGVFHPTTGAVISTDPQNGVSSVLGITYRDDAEVKTVGFGLDYDVSSKTTISSNVNYFTEDRKGQYIGVSRKPSGIEVPPAYIVKNTPVNSMDDNRRIDLSFDVEHTTANEAIIKVRAYRSDYKKRNVTTALNFTAPKNTKFSADVVIDGLEANSSFFIGDENLLTAGIEYRKETRDSSAINPDPFASEFITKKLNYKSLFIQDEIEISDSLNATVGARYDNISNADTETTFKAGIIKNLDNGINIRANVAQGYRVPDIAELYVVAPVFRDARRFGSEVIFGAKTAVYDLNPESSLSTEFAVSKRGDKFQSELVIFQNKIKDKIELVAVNDGLPSKYYTSQNLEKVQIRGAEFSAKFDINTQLDLNFNATYLDTKDESINKELTFTPKYSAAVNVNYQLNSKLSSTLSIKRIGKQYTDTANTEKADGFVVANLSLNQKLNNSLEIYGGVNNIGDNTIDEALGADVGRYFYMGLRSDF